ncbi:jg18879 [Pararge aegeria aegeria]|uniref:Jg18879 protein n=1 Tax=Pararge aegeria aegeria TaxID=348720 RepID=A0A8S4RR33_9NEOP|nr:jg18879 [Pararge aegeria aegeria]
MQRSAAARGSGSCGFKAAPPEQRAGWHHAAAPSGSIADAPRDTCPEQCHATIPYSGAVSMDYIICIDYFRTCKASKLNTI